LRVVATLQRQQANALVAYLNYKKYHWLSYGPLFRDIHYTRLVQVHQKSRWFLNEILQKRDGLTS
jgi:DNA-binding ferritin-like protein